MAVYIQPETPSEEARGRDELLFDGSVEDAPLAGNESSHGDAPSVAGENESRRPA